MERVDIYENDDLIVPLNEIQFIEKLKYGIWLITKHTNWNFHKDCWDNPIFIPDKYVSDFLTAWYKYRDLSLTLIKQTEVI